MIFLFNYLANMRNPCNRNMSSSLAVIAHKWECAINDLTIV